MSKILDLKCSNCGASLDVESGDTSVICSYCGSQCVILEDTTGGSSAVSVNQKISIRLKDRPSMTHLYRQREQLIRERAEIKTDLDSKRRTINERKAEEIRQFPKTSWRAWGPGIGLFFIVVGGTSFMVSRELFPFCGIPLITLGIAVLISGSVTESKFQKERPSKISLIEQKHSKEIKVLEESHNRMLEEIEERISEINRGLEDV